MTRKFRPILAIALVFSVSACGYSPLLNHENAIVASPDAPRRTTPAVPQSGGCPNGSLELKKSAMCVSFTWDAGPSADSENSATLQFSDGATGSPRDADGDVAVQLWMPSMGHGSSPVTVTPRGAGAYAASRVYFVMPGDWEIRIQIKKNGKVFDQASFEIVL